MSTSQHLSMRKRRGLRIIRGILFARYLYRYRIFVIAILSALIAWWYKKIKVLLPLFLDVGTVTGTLLFVFANLVGD